MLANGSRRNRFGDVLLKPLLNGKLRKNIAKNFESMYSQTGVTQLTFYYLDGHTESFNISNPEEAGGTQQEIRQQLHRLFDSSWWVLHLADQTVCINTTNVVKVEVKPSIPYLQGENVFPNAERLTALTRGPR
jgi:hypothetical protein